MGTKKMKLTGLLVASAAAQNSLVDVFTSGDRKFSDNPLNDAGLGWLDQQVWANYHDQRPAYRVKQLRCRINQFFDSVFADNDRINNKLQEKWNGVLNSIENSFQKCHGPLYAKEVNCNWQDWLDDEPNKVTNTFVTWFGVAVREFIYRSDEKASCEATGMRLFKRLDRMNAYLQWHYCDKISDSEDCVFWWRYDNNVKRNTHPRSDSQKHGISKFDAYFHRFTHFHHVK